MAKKKKTTKVETITPADTIKYEGAVKVSIVKGKKVISTKTYHNTGHYSMFHFICECLAGNFDSSTRPCKLVFYGLGDETTDLPTNPDLSKDRLATTIAVLANTAAVTKVETTTETYASVTYHFLVPFAYIKGSSNNVKIYKAGLLKNNADLNYTAAASELCASYLFSKKDPSGNEIWDPLTLGDTTIGNYSVIIEWELKIKN